MNIDINTLREQIRYHERKYYIDDQPEISDAEFDALMRQIEELEKASPDDIPSDSPTQRVGWWCCFRFAYTTQKSDAKS